MALLLTLVVLFLPQLVYALGDQEVLYVRPVGACTFNGNGSAYTCAASAGATGAKIGFNNVTWSATDGTSGQVDPNDILYVCGTHVVTSVNVTQRIRPSQNGNSTDGYIIVDGSCPGDAGTMDGTGTGARLGWLDDRSYIHLRYLTFRNAGSNDYVVSVYNQGQQDNDRNIIIEHCNFYDNLDITAVIWAWGAGFDFSHNYFENSGADQIYFKGGRDVTASYNVFRAIDPSASPAPDCIQFDSTNVASTGTTILNYNDCDKTGAADTKYGILAADRTGPTEIIGNRMICPVSSTSASGCSPILTGHKPAAQTGEIKIHSNYVRKGWRGITVYAGANASFPVQIIGNDVEGAGTIGVWLHNTVDYVLVANNTLVGNGVLSATPASGAHGLYVTKSNSTNIDIKNNIFASNYRGYFFPGTFGGTVEYNAYFNQTSWNVDNGSQGSIEGTALTANPLFNNAANSDYRLDGPSPLRQAGTDVTECVDRHSLPCTSTPDIGAYQHRHGGRATGRLTPQAGGR